MFLLSDFTREITRACNEEERADDAVLSRLSRSGHMVLLLTAMINKAVITSEPSRHMV